MNSGQEVHSDELGVRGHPPPRLARPRYVIRAWHIATLEFFSYLWYTTGVACSRHASRTSDDAVALRPVGATSRSHIARVQAFESVVPSERTKVAVTIIDSSLRLLQPSHPGALVAHIGEMDFSTTLVGNSAETSFHLEVPALSIFLVDDLSGKRLCSFAAQTVTTDPDSTIVAHVRR